MTAWDAVVDESHVPGRQLKVNVVWDDFPSDEGWVWSYWNLGYGGSWLFTEGVWRDGRNAMNGYGYEGTGAPSPDEWDFRTIMLHELGHSMGSKRSYTVREDDAFWARAFLDWEKPIADDNGDKPVGFTNGFPDNFDESGPQWWTGENADSVYGGRVPMWLPRGHEKTLEDGTSIMDIPSDWAGFVLRNPTPLDAAFLEDLGWMVVPEPSTLILLGMGAIGLSARKRRKRR